MSVSESIIKTMAYFDLFNRPLTNFELYHWLYAPAPSENMSQVLAAAERLKPGIQEIDGLFFLSFRDLPIQRALANDRKFQIAQKAARLICLAPFVRLAAVCNTLSFNAAEEESDIDFFIVAKSGRLWTARFFIILILSLFCLRRHGKKIKNRICLSFFVTDDNLNLQSIALPPPDIYLIYWISQLIPLINRDQTLEKFWQANRWIKNYLANFSFETQLPDYRQIKISFWAEKLRRFLEIIMSGCLGDWRERIFRRLQLRKMKGNLLSRRWEGGTAVIVSDKMLKFHEEDRREEYRQKWACSSAG